jgi:hypothetical protein
VHCLIELYGSARVRSLLHRYLVLDFFVKMHVYNLVGEHKDIHGAMLMFVRLALRGRVWFSARVWDLFYLSHCLAVTSRFPVEPL